jgi:cystathionine beta-lyase/cystathionine gamma-synthase
MDKKTITDILFNVGEEKSPNASPVVPPIYQSSNFSFESVADLRSAFVNERTTNLYTRGNNPTVDIVRKKIAALAGAEDALIVSSGASAISIAILSQVQAGDHIVCIKNPYSWTEKFCKNILAKFGVETTFWDIKENPTIDSLLQVNTKVVFLESPNTFTFEIQDLQTISAICRERNMISIIDNTYSTPLGQRCIEIGIDIEIHSISKYLNGHSDVIAGAIIGATKIIDPIFRSEFLNFGTIVSPNDAWLILRGLRTLPQRMEAIAISTKKIVDFLHQQDWVESVLHPMDNRFGQYDLAAKQMSWYGGLFSILVNENSIEKIEQFCHQLDFFKMAVSWGGHESLIMPCCAFYPKDYTGLRKYPHNMLRLYIGLENSDDLILDLKQSAEVFVK